MNIRQAVTVEDVHSLARSRVPRFILDLVEGGAGRENTVRANEVRFRDVEFSPRPLIDARQRNLATSLFGEALSMPLLLAPTGAGRVLHRDAELVVARAAHRAKTVYVQSTVTSFSLEDVAGHGGPLWFQMYLPPTRDATRALIGRVKDAGYRALVLTIDTPVTGKRHRDLRNGVTNQTVKVPIRPDLIMQAIGKPRWAVEFLRGHVGPGRTRGTAATAADGRPRRMSLAETTQLMASAQWPVTWEDLRFVRSTWDGPLLVKGVMRPEECDALVGEGVDGVIVSNHGGRQLDDLPATIEVLPAIVGAIGGRAEVLMDGGIRDGADVIKAIAMGASACLIGRPYLYGLAAAGEEGVSRVLEILRSEMDRTMVLLGCRRMADVDSSLVRHRWGGAAGRDV